MTYPHIPKDLFPVLGRSKVGRVLSEVKDSPKLRAKPKDSPKTRLLRFQVELYRKITTVENIFLIVFSRISLKGQGHEIRMA